APGTAKHLNHLPKTAASPDHCGHGAIDVPGNHSLEFPRTTLLYTINNLRRLIMAICDWGPRVDAGNLPDLYAPQKVLPFTPTPAGIDNLALSSIDTFVVPGVGTFEVNFSGYFRVAREASPADTWAS